jgi:hypothetical protein
VTKSLTHSQLLGDTLLPHQVTNSLQGRTTVIFSAWPLLLSAYWENLQEKMHKAIAGGKPFAKAEATPVQKPNHADNHWVTPHSST